jgi:hypothetical protein
MPSSKPQIPEWLAKASFEDLFLSTQSPLPADQSDLLASLAPIASSPDAPPRLRVLAHELLIENGRDPDPSLAEVYCLTLPDTFPHNAWGMPGHYTERLGKTIVAFGKAALGCLVKLLEDKRPLSYFGSEEPTLSEAMQYRVGDLTAYFVSLITGAPYRDAPNIDTRDAYIRQLITELGE